MRLPLCTDTALATAQTAPAKAPRGEFSSSMTTRTLPTRWAWCSGSTVTRWFPRTRVSRRLEQAQSFKPEIVLLDIGLPGVDGYEVARRIRALADLQTVRLVAITGYGQDADKARARAAGFADHLVKPVEFTALQRILTIPATSNPRIRA